MAFNNRFNDDAPANPMFQQEFARGGDPSSHPAGLNLRP